MTRRKLRPILPPPVSQRSAANLPQPAAPALPTVRNATQTIVAKPQAIVVRPQTAIASPQLLPQSSASDDGAGVPPEALPVVHTPNALVMRGEFWEARYRDRSAIVEDCRGLRYIARLIQHASAGKGPMHAKELVALVTGQEPAAVELEMKDSVLDPKAQKQLLTRLEEIAVERDRACAAEDFGRATALDAEHERIADELTHTARRGLFSHSGEKARKAVSKAISEAVSRIAACPDLAPLAQHLAGAIRKGQWLSYSGNTGWHIDFRGALPRK